MNRHTEHVDISGHLCVPVSNALDRPPHRDGWEAFWVNVNLADKIAPKVFKYRRIEQDAA